MDLILLSNFQPSFWIKLVTLVVIGFYAIFTFVVFSQIKVMTQILRLPHAKEVLKIISVANIFLTISLFLFAVVIL